MSNALDISISQMVPAVEREMKSVLRFEEATTPDPFYGMMHYHMGWVDADLQPEESNGGKRIRPVLCLLSCAAAGGSWEQAVPAGAAIELLHNFTLIHDDIQDASPTRRGRPTVWKLWGMEQAINSGDCMFALAHSALYRLADQGVPPATVVRAAESFDHTCLKLTQGQYRDMDFETRQDVTVDEYLEMIGGKTAALLTHCGELGALIAGAEEEKITHYAMFARELGLAFQVKDDILGIWGNEEAIGKSAATDIETRKKTLPVLYGLNQSTDLRALYEQPENGQGFVSDVVQLLDECGARTYAETMAARYSESAISHLDAAQPEGDAARALHDLADLLLTRQH
ncbi:MAG: polyprenyl synthetase family protein [Chloroflexota bacterium]